MPGITASTGVNMLITQLLSGSAATLDGAVSISTALKNDGFEVVICSPPDVPTTY